MPEVLKENTTINTTIGRIIDFAADLCAEWAPAFYISITRDGKDSFSRHRFNEWLDSHRNKLNWNNLYPDNICNAKLRSGKNKGMRCSKKTKTKYEIKMVDGLEYKKEIETPFCGLHQNLMKEDMLQEERDELIYQGEAPVKNESKKMRDLKKRLTKVHNSLKLSDDPSDEDIIKTVEQLCVRMNKVELDRVRMYSSLRRMNKFMKKLPGVTKEYLDNWDKELEKEANASYTGNQEIASEIDVLKWKHMRFEDVAPKEMQEEVQRKRDEICERHMANYVPAEKRNELKKKYKAKEEEILKDVKSEDKVIVPTAKEVAEGSQTVWLGTGAAIMAEPQEPKLAVVQDVE
ncbi:hypothetical protein IWW42_005798 [Coemansia sp. RSA 1085]|nr:hypothetical protein IWW42_005798 [Coemansia sp. RSA 1085]